MKNYFFLISIIFFSSTYSMAQDWMQLGNSIEGEDLNDHSASVVQLDGDGNRIIIGSKQNVGGGNIINKYGHIRIFEYNGSSWKQLGSDIDGENNKKLGGILTISQDGNVIALGTNPLEILKWNGASWQKHGLNQPNTSFNINTDHNNISLNCDGSIIAFSDPFDNGDTLSRSDCGKVSIFHLNNNIWELKGNHIYGDNAYDYSGESISLNCDGYRIAIGAVGHSDNGAKSGQIRVFEFDGTNWKQLGNEILGNSKDCYAGRSIAISDSGNHVVFGAPSVISGGGVKEGYVSVYEYKDSLWSIIGSEISGGIIGTLFGSSVDISSKGKRVLVGAPNNNTNGIKSGLSIVYELDSLNNWIPVFTLNGTSSEEFCGKSVSISSNGKIAAFGIPGGDGFYSNSGLTKVFEDKSYLHLTNNLGQQKFKIFPNPSNGKFFIEGFSNNLLNIEIYNSLGQLILKTSTDSYLNIMELTIPNYKGLAFVKINQYVYSTLIE